MTVDEFAAMRKGEAAATRGAKEADDDGAEFKTKEERAKSLGAGGFGEGRKEGRTGGFQSSKDTVWSLVQKFGLFQ